MTKPRFTAGQLYTLITGRGDPCEVYLFDRLEELLNEERMDPALAVAQTKLEIALAAQACTTRH